MKILVLNSGSSSQKSALYEIAEAVPTNPLAPLWQGKIEWSADQAEVQVQNSQGANLKENVKVESRRHAIEQLLDTLWSGKARVVSTPSEISVVGHRVVHGGQDYAEPLSI